MRYWSIARRVLLLLLLYAHEISIVSLPLFCGSKSCVRFANLYEFLRGCWIVWMEIGMIRLGEFVELSKIS